MSVVTRFAPSPTGFLHLGHAAAAWFGWERARRVGGRFLLRIEDIDPVRCRADYAAAIEADLVWLGLAWDGPVLVQSHHMTAYAGALQRLETAGLLYPCFCSRSAIMREAAAAAAAPHGPDGAPLYPGTCRHLGATERRDRLATGEAHAWRLDMAAAAAAATARTGPLSFHEAGQGRLACDAAAFGDVVLGRKDIPASYHLCVSHDDAAQGVTLVTRAVDLMPCTAVHRLLQVLLDWPEPGYAHHPMLLDAAGQRLAKRHAAPALRDLRAQGVAAADVLLRARSGIEPG